MVLSGGGVRGVAHAGVFKALEESGIRIDQLSGSSAGAMVMCEHYYDPHERKLLRGLNLVPNACVLPHHNNFGRGWAGQIKQKLPEAVLLGIDERTGMVNNADGDWEVKGGGEVTLYRSDSIVSYGRGETFSL